ncbi:MAG: type II toxin-antitoxin system HicB family antitoxin [Planctomycetales bacterium]
MLKALKSEMSREPHSFLCEVALCREPDGYSAYATTLPGCASQGETKCEAVRNVRQALSAYLDSFLSVGEPIPWIPRRVDEANPPIKLPKLKIRIPR